MKVYKVTVQRDGATCKSPGVTSTVQENHDYYYAAETIDDAWETCKDLRTDPEGEFQGIWEVLPMIQVVPHIADPEAP